MASKGKQKNIQNYDDHYWLQAIDDAIVPAIIKVDRTKLRKYLRNWVTALISQEKLGNRFVRLPKR